MDLANELLNNIFFFLPEDSLLSVALVCRHFKDLLEPRLHNSLYLNIAESTTDPSGICEMRRRQSSRLITHLTEHPDLAARVKKCKLKGLIQCLTTISLSCLRRTY